MIVYSGTKNGFQKDVMSNDIGNIILEKYREVTGKNTGKSEIDSWTNSLQYMDRVLADSDIPHDAGVAIEYHIPQSSKRIDFILSGKNHSNVDTAILVELKQWQTAEITTKDGVVITRFKHGEKETSHPSIPGLVIQVPTGRLQSDSARRKNISYPVCLFAQLRSGRRN